MNKMAIGTAQFGMDYGISNMKGQLGEFEISNILNYAKKNGINTLDTAKGYGNSEESIGNYLIKYPDSSWQIITKVDEHSSSLIDLLQDSELKLGLNPTLFLAHTAELFINKKFQDELQIIKQNNLIKKIGVSLYTEAEIIKVLESNFIPEIIQLPMNILDTRLYHNGIIKELSRRKIEIHARSVFLQGVFYLSDNDIVHRFHDANKAIQQLKYHAKIADLTLAELSLLWLVNLEEISKVIIGVESVDQLNNHLQTLKKIVEPNIFEAALEVRYENESILNPSLWK